jgi:hypothetical protein
MHRQQLTINCLYVSMIVAFLYLMNMSGAVRAAGDQDATQASSDAKPSSHLPVIFTPPRRGAPQARIGAGARGKWSEAIFLCAMAPEQVGLTRQVQPALYWYTNKPSAARFKLESISEKGLESVLEVMVESGKSPGVEHLNLRDHSISLSPGIPYQWSVTLVKDEEDRSSDIVASGVIELVKPDSALNNLTQENHGVEGVRTLASNGIWYDAISTISTLIEKTPDNIDTREIRASMLMQVGLKGAAKADRQYPVPVTR